MKEKVIVTVLFTLSILLYVLTVRGIYGNPTGKMVKNNLDQASKPFELSPERGRYLLVIALGENKSFSLNQELADAAYPDVGYYKGKFYIFFAPGVSLVSLPLYWIGKQFNVAQVATYLTISLFAALTLVFLYKICRNIFNLPIWASLTAPLIFGFGSTSWSYANTLYQHHITVFCIIASLYAAWKYKQNKAYNWIWALFIWINFALAIGVDYPNVALMAPVMFYFFLTAIKVTIKNSKTLLSLRASFLITSVAFVIISLVHGYFNYTHFGGWTKVSNGIVGYKILKELKILKAKDPEKKIAELEKNKVPIRFFKEDNLPRGLTILLFAVDKGIFLFSPIFILGVVGIITLIPHITLEIGILLASILVNMFLYSSFGDPWGGWAYGPRYLIPTMSYLSIFIAIWIAKTRFQLIGRLLTLFLFAISSAIALLGALTTNAVPPKVEADYLKMKYNFMLNWEFLQDHRSSSFVYNTFLQNMSLLHYFAYIVFALTLIMYLILFVLPLFKEFNKK